MTSSGAPDITGLLQEWRAGDERAAEALVPLVYAELRKIAAGYLSIERPGHTLQPTALVHEAYLRLVEQQDPSWQSRSHFYAIAAKVIRRILVDHARRHHSAKRGGGGEKVPLSEVADFAVERPDQLVTLDEALGRLAAIDPLQVTVIEHRFFGGLTGEQTAAVLGLSPATVKRRWRLAKAWLYRELTRAQP
jgi:RNA polymerase sigma factor (TIGR02999 family)